MKRFFIIMVAIFFGLNTNLTFARENPSEIKMQQNDWDNIKKWVWFNTRLENSRYRFSHKAQEGSSIEYKYNTPFCLYQGVLSIPERSGSKRYIITNDYSLTNNKVECFTNVSQNERQFSWLTSEETNEKVVTITITHMNILFMISTFFAVFLTTIMWGAYRYYHKKSALTLPKN